VGYVYARELDYDRGNAIWIDSLAVLPGHKWYVDQSHVEDEEIVFQAGTLDRG
jgi:hypothetical protein